jgi:hypothetical protein
MPSSSYSISELDDNKCMFANGPHAIVRPKVKFTTSPSKRRFRFHLI